MTVATLCLPFSLNEALQHMIANSFMWHEGGIQMQALIVCESEMYRSQTQWYLSYSP